MLWKSDEGKVVSLLSMVCYSFLNFLFRFQLNHVVRLSRFSVKFVPERFRLGDLPHELQLTNFSYVVSVGDDEASLIPELKFSYIPISSIADHPVGSFISKISIFCLFSR